ARLLCFAACGWFFFASAAGAADRALPPADKLEAAKRLVVDTFRKELSETDKIPAVKAMLEAAESTTNDPPAKAALYLSAAETAARSGDTKLAFSALEQLGVAFDCDVLGLKDKLLETVAKSARTADERTSIANRSLELADAAAAAGRFDLAESALKTAGMVSAKLRDAEIRKDVATRRRNIEKAKRQHEQEQAATAAALKKLEERPDDPAANEAYGKHLAFDRHDWAAGLKHLTKSADADLQKVAAADRAGAEASGAMATLGDAWWAFAERSDSPRDRAGYQSRAVFWYTRAIGGLSGFAKTRLEKRIKDAGDEALASAAQQTGGASDKYLDITLAPGVLMRLVKIPAIKDGKIKEFYLGQTEVTQRQWQAVMGGNPSAVKGDLLPVSYVSVDDCNAFFERIRLTNPRLKFTLATNDELMHAFLAGRPISHYMDHAEKFFWTRDNSGKVPHPVASLKANDWGLYDMIGNSAEWCASGNMWGGSVWDSAADQRQAPIDRPHDQPTDGAIGFRVAADLN
ncbi:MAG TPA: SUMF1/EgtB/PvdO family nonheme iron enzyme, partial [Pirellulales bacterium]|nr:SUMF1/EgtB/PvdO family nonheme iron enzyme [Pirellulales bacterium]